MEMATLRPMSVTHELDLLLGGLDGVGAVDDVL
jgi:hypothetical protein